MRDGESGIRTSSKLGLGAGGFCAEPFVASGIEREKRAPHLETRVGAGCEPEALNLLSDEKS